MIYELWETKTEIGNFGVITREGRIVKSYFGEKRQAIESIEKNKGEVKTVNSLAGISGAVEEYFSGENLKSVQESTIEVFGSPFFLEILGRLRKIQPGEKSNYAKLGGGRRFSRAVGTVCSLNPVPIFIPCHRIIKTDGRLGGYGYGQERKSWLIAHEQGA